MNIYKLYANPDFIGYLDLDDKEFTFTIESCEVVTVKNWKNQDEVKAALKFKGAHKRLLLNKTNAAVIWKVYSKDTDRWIGKAITLYPTTCVSREGPNTPCVRVKVPRSNHEPNPTHPS